MDSADYTSHTVVFTKDDLVMLVQTGAGEGDTGVPTAIEVAKKQYAML